MKIMRSKNAIIFLSVILLVSFALHMVIKHDHSEDHFGTGIQAVFHGEDKKWWALFALASIFFALAKFLRKRLNIDAKSPASKSYLYLTFYISKIFDSIREALRRGILNPKLCE